MTAAVWLIVLASAFLHALWNLATKQVRGDLGIICVGMGLAALVALPTGVMSLSAADFGARASRFVLTRGVLQTVYFVTLAYAYRSGDLSFIYPIARGVGIAIAAILGAGFLHEKISVVAGIGIVTVVLGTFTIAAHPARERIMRALVMALACGVTVGFMSINDKMAAGLLKPEYYIFAMHVLCFILLAPYVLIRHPRQFRAAWQKHLRAASVVGIGSMLSYFLILFAFRMGKVSYVAPVRESAVVIGAGMGFLVLKERLTWRKGIGILAITVGVVLIKLAH